MKTVHFLTLTLASTFIFTSCKDTVEPTTETSSKNNEVIALAETDVSEEMISEVFLYVTAATGLSLREYNNLQSEKLAIMPYGSKLKVVSHETNNTMTVQNINGGMDEVEFNHKKGFAFNGYLSKFFPPEEDIFAKAYAKELKSVFPKVAFTETTGGTASKPINTETLVLPASTWHEAFFIAKKLYHIPREFVFPSSNGAKKQTVKGPKKENEIWFDALEITRNDAGFETIEYKYTSKKGVRTVTISKDKKALKIVQVFAHK